MQAMVCHSGRMGVGHSSGHYFAYIRRKGVEGRRSLGRSRGRGMRLSNFAKSGLAANNFSEAQRKSPSTPNVTPRNLKCRLVDHRLIITGVWYLVNDKTARPAGRNWEAGTDAAKNSVVYLLQLKKGQSKCNFPKSESPL